MLATYNSTHFPNTLTLNTSERPPQHLDRIETTLANAKKNGLDIKQTNLPHGTTIDPDLSFSFTYNAQQKQWQSGGKHVSYLTPFRIGYNIPSTQPPITFVNVTSHNWLPAINLPKEANNNDVIVLSSSASYDTRITGDNLRSALPLTLKQGEQQVFRYSTSHHGWTREQAEPSTTIDPVKPEISKLNQPLTIALKGAKTVVSFNGAGVPGTVKLPSHANDRDRVFINSTSRQTVNVDSSNMNNAGAIKVAAGQNYEFMYIAEDKKWEVLNAPLSRYTTRQLIDGRVPALTTPKTIIDIPKDNWKDTLQLPSNSTPGSRVVVKSDSARPVTIKADPTDHTIKPGEIIAFKVDSDNKWTRETVTIDLLLLYSDKARNLLGTGNMKARLTDGLNLTNEALENSRANFRFRSTDIREVPAEAHWKKLIDPLTALKDDPTVQGWRDELKADGIYYEGTENDLGGQGYLKADARHMAAVGSIYSSTRVMRHELGHNMGISHGGESTSYDQGYSDLGTIMGGNDIGFYSTPNRYTRDGRALGFKNKIDAVRAMNEFSATVANYR